MQVQENIDLKPFNSFGLSAQAKYFIALDNMPMLQQLLHEPKWRAMPLLVLGGGSNILLTQNFDGLVLKQDFKGIRVVQEDDKHVYVQAQAGEVWHNFVQFCLQHNYAGVENLSLIPGSVGASPMQNIGAYGVEIKDVFHSLEAYHIASAEVHHFNLDDCKFGYRESVFKQAYKDQYIILNVTYKLNKQPIFRTTYGAIQEALDAMQISHLSIQAIAQAVIQIRSSKLPNPREIGNAGSFFKNPVISTEQLMQLQANYPNIPHYPTQDAATKKVAAGWLIEQCGWKGYRKGDAGCHAKQALVLVNYGAATGAEILGLSQDIITSVQEKFGITLEKEVNII